VAYLGHGEIAVLLRSVDDVDASAIVARIRDAVGERRIRTSHAMAKTGEIYGTLCAVDTHPHPALGERHIELLGFLSDLAAELIEDEAEQQSVRRVEARADGVRTLLVALEARDFYTSEHSKQVVELAAAVAGRLGLDQDATCDVEQVALLHDIGKVGIPDAILQKQGPLDEQEWQLMRQHPIVGEHIIAGTPGLSHLAPAMRPSTNTGTAVGTPTDSLARRSRWPAASRSPATR
jgi:HD-GYP domain-containing protein (c-di-GMP phosphodiesterase class II)